MSFLANLLDTALMVMSTSARSSSIDCSVRSRALCSSIHFTSVKGTLVVASHNLPYAGRSLTDGKLKFFFGEKFLRNLSVKSDAAYGRFCRGTTLQSE